MITPGFVLGLLHTCVPLLPKRYPPVRFPAAPGGPGNPLLPRFPRGPGGPLVPFFPRPGGPWGPVSPSGPGGPGGPWGTKNEINIWDYVGTKLNIGRPSSKKVTGTVFIALLHSKETSTHVCDLFVYAFRAKWLACTSSEIR